MTDCSTINQQLVDAQNQLTQIEQELRDPRGTCINEGFEPGSDACTLFLKCLHDQAGEINITIGLLQPLEDLCQLLVGAWNLTITNAYTGQVITSAQLTLEGLDAWNDVQTGPTASVYGSLLFSDDPVLYELFEATYETHDPV